VGVILVCWRRNTVGNRTGRIIFCEITCYLGEGECPFCGELGDGHFGHLRFKNFLIFDFDGHLFVGCECSIKK
jgi:hypothetical protein